MSDTFRFTGIIFKDEVGFAALCPELDVATDGSDIAVAKAMLFEAVTLYLESAIESNLPYLRPVSAAEDPRQTQPQSVVEVFPLNVNISVHAYP